MALIVSITHAVQLHGKLKAKCETIVFEDEKEGRQFIKDNATFVFSVQKARIVKDGNTTAKV